jgi:hypothetical protein
MLRGHRLRDDQAVLQWRPLLVRLNRRAQLRLSIGVIPTEARSELPAAAAVHHAALAHYRHLLDYACTVDQLPTRTYHYSSLFHMAANKQPAALDSEGRKILVIYTGGSIGMCVPALRLWIGSAEEMNLTFLLQASVARWPQAVRRQSTNTLDEDASVS